MARIFVDVAIFCFCIELFTGRFPFSFCVSINRESGGPSRLRVQQDRRSPYVYENRGDLGLDIILLIAI